jgi:hypothetical protein
MNEKLIARMKSPGPKKILALDGGGIRGLMSVAVLAEIETLLRKRLARGPISSPALVPAPSSRSVSQ